MERRMRAVVVLGMVEGGTMFGSLGAVKRPEERRV
jgi:hypothetical protein